MCNYLSYSCKSVRCVYVSTFVRILSSTLHIHVYNYNYNYNCDLMILSFIDLGSNWASRQGLTDMVRYYLKSLHVKTGEQVSDVKLSIAEEVSAFLS